MENVEMIQMLYEAEATIFRHCYHRQHNDMQHVMAQAELSCFRNIHFQTDGTGSIQVGTSLNHSA